ncbi:ATP-dependent RNA helicase [Phlyctochytrium bullatum]|nr:ATP-dependent RNA helicase [Phlyctochytrium bullatum]
MAAKKLKKALLTTILSSRKKVEALKKPKTTSTKVTKRLKIQSTPNPHALKKVFKSQSLLQPTREIHSDDADEDSKLGTGKKKGQRKASKAESAVKLLVSFEDDTTPGPELLEFTSLDISPPLLEGIKGMRLERLSPFQIRTLPRLLNGLSLVGVSSKSTESTVTYLLPALEFVIKLKFKARNGIGAVIVTSNREAASQIYLIARDLLKGTTHNVGLILEGSSKRPEAEKLGKGLNVIVGTPGAILDHFLHTHGFEYKHTGVFVADEADYICNAGAAKDVRQIRNMLSNVRQVIVFSSVLPEKVKQLALALAIPGREMKTVVNELRGEQATQAGQITGHSHVVCQPQSRFLMLFTFLSKNLPDKKIIVLFSSTESLRFHAEMLGNIDIPVSTIHNEQTLPRRSEDYLAYVRKVTVTGQVLLFLLPHEVEFLKRLKTLGANSGELSVKEARAEKFQAEIEKSVEKNYLLYKSSLDGYKAYVQAYAGNLLKKYFAIESLDIPKVAKAFGFKVPPRVNFKSS